MAMESHRAQLEIYNVLGMCKQAFSSFRRNFTLLLVLALVSSIYETAVERSDLLSGVSFPAKSSRYALQLSFSSNQQSERISNSWESDTIRQTMVQPEASTGSDELNGEDSLANMENRKTFSTENNDGMGMDKENISNEFSRDDETVSDSVSNEFSRGYEIDSDRLPRLVIQMVSNETKQSSMDMLEDSLDFSVFTGRFLGGRGLDQGAMPHGGFALLVMLLFAVIAMVIFLAIVGFQHTAVIGSVAYSVLATHMGRRVSVKRAIRAGFRTGITRLMWLAILHTILRGLLSLFFVKTLFGGVMEVEQLEQLIFRLTATPFAFLAPFMDVDATDVRMAFRIGLFVGMDYIFEGIAYCMYVVACWVTIMETEYQGVRAFSRSWNLIKCMDVQAVVVGSLEVMVCGRSFWWVLQLVLGAFPATFLVSIAQLYFLVLWLIFYLSARCLHDGPAQFSYRNLEDFLERVK